MRQRLCRTYAVLKTLLIRRLVAGLAMIDATYGHLAPDAERVELELLDADDETFEQLADPDQAQMPENPCSDGQCGREDSNLQGLAPDGS